MTTTFDNVPPWWSLQTKNITRTGRSTQPPKPAVHRCESQSRRNVCGQSHLQRDVSSRGYVVKFKTWWRHQMETFSALLAICAGNSPVPGEFHTQRPVTQSFDVFFDLRLNKRLSKQSWGWWFETLSRLLWRHSNGIFEMATPDNTLHAFKQCHQTVQYLVFRNSSYFKRDVFYPG